MGNTSSRPQTSYVSNDLFTACGSSSAFIRKPTDILSSGSRLTLALSTKLLPVHGQGVVVFDAIESCVLFITTPEGDDGIEVTFEPSGVTVIRPKIWEKYVDPNCHHGLSSNPGAFYWFSLDSQNQVFYAGIGEPRIETAAYRYAFKTDDKTQREKNKAFLESLTTVRHDPAAISIDRLLKHPIQSTPVPFAVKTMDQLTMLDVAKQSYMPLEHLSPVSQKLYHCIGGERFVLDDDDFPDFSKAIEYSIATKGCWCNTRLRQKSTEFNPDKPNLLETYLRITMGQNNGDSPGQMLVMEIWPKGGHYSPIHSHANCEAIIRVLHGSINVTLFPFLCGEPHNDLGDYVAPFANRDFNQGDVTWISPSLNQIHQLRNLSNETSCITIQCYEYDEGDVEHYDYFDYLDDNGVIQQYEPDSDCDFVVFREIMRQEWASRTPNQDDQINTPGM